MPPKPSTRSKTATLSTIDLLTSAFMLIFIWIVCLLTRQWHLVAADLRLGLHITCKIWRVIPRTLALVPRWLRVLMTTTHYRWNSPANERFVDSFECIYSHFTNQAFPLRQISMSHLCSSSVATTYCSKIRKTWFIRRLSSKIFLPSLV